jgi:ADP-dependent NAD(P)H-hydrate dehydratase / NAD(P)H-hydrate epimerase
MNDSREMSARTPTLSPKTISQSQVIANFPQRPRDSHKGLFGTVAVIGGTDGMIGAPLLAARAALKLGAGCVHVGLLAENAPGVDLLQPELMLHSARDILSSTPFALSLSKGNFDLACGSTGSPRTAY